MPENPDHRIIEFNRLNLLGKAVYLAGATVNTTLSLLDLALDKAVDLVIETEKAFREGHDDTIEDAHIIEEHQDKTSQGGG